MKITGQRTDLADKHRVTVDLHDDGNLTMLKFHEEPTPEQIQVEVDRLIAAEVAAAAAAAEAAATQAAADALMAEVLAALAGGIA